MTLRMMPYMWQDFLNSSKDKIWKMVAYKCDKCGKWHVGSTHKRLTDEERERYGKKLNKKY